MAERATITVSKAESIGAMLQESAPPDRQMLTKRQAIMLLKEAIESAKEKGYTLEEIAKILGEGGLHISIGVLRVYLREATKGKRQKSSKSSEARATTSKVEPKSNRAAEGAEAKPETP
jgi:hypothetical protein